MVENTTQRDPAVHLLGAISEGIDGYIAGMEADGQRQVVQSDALPIEAPWDELEALGFVRGEPLDDLFCHCTLPAGWTKAGTGHAMWSNVLDERGITRVAVFYKAAFYDRKAGAHLTSPGSEMATDVIYGDDPVALPPLYGLLTEEEEQDFWAGVDGMKDRIARNPDIWGKHAPRVAALEALRSS